MIRSGLRWRDWPGWLALEGLASRSGLLNDLSEKPSKARPKEFSLRTTGSIRAGGAFRASIFARELILL